MTAPTHTPPRASSRWLDRVLAAMFLLSLAVVCFVGGAYVAEFEVPWYQRVLQPSFRGLRAAAEQSVLLKDQKSIDWDLAREEKPGVTIYRPELAYDGLTMYVSFGETPSASLISMTGDVVHRWHLPFGKVWPNPPHVKQPPPEEFIHWHTARMFKNGDLIANYCTASDTPYGYGLVKMDKDSKVLWRYSECAHHDFDVDEAGKIYALRQSIHDEAVDGAPQLSTPVLQDFVVVLSPEGKELERIALYEAFAKSKFRHYLEAIPSDPKGDHTHSNGIDVISKDFAEKHGICAPGDVMISIRNACWLAILNLKRREIVWVARGVWLWQHDPDPLANGNILLFDNCGKRTAGGESRILEWNPVSGAIEWSFRGTDERKFESLSRGCQQLLPNGNVLITESNNGRLLEVTRDGQVAWEFNNPHRYEETNKYVAVVTSAQRLAASELTFLKPASAAESNPSRSQAAADKAKNAVR
ncbi:MAG TPA: arylsulfotransferase family protein [Pirellulaceae bacterium]|nr:arylsulfotransferase family protein [Pirellulaceae bacterium]